MGERAITSGTTCSRGSPSSWFDDIDTFASSLLPTEVSGLTERVHRTQPWEYFISEEHIVIDRPCHNGSSKCVRALISPAF
jgi:hypothetical protein